MRIRTSKTGKTALLALLLAVTVSGHAQQTDPALTAAVTTQTFTLKSLFDARHSTQEKILAATGIEDVQLQQLHDIEKKVLDYMANVSGLMQNLYQVKRTTELVTVEIPRNISEVTRACKGHLKGTAIALAVSDEIRSVYTEIASLSALCTSLVKTQGQPAECRRTLLAVREDRILIGGHQLCPLYPLLADTISVMGRPLARPRS